MAVGGVWVEDKDNVRLAKDNTNFSESVFRQLVNNGGPAIKGCLKFYDPLKKIFENFYLILWPAVGCNGCRWASMAAVRWRCVSTPLLCNGRSLHAATYIGSFLYLAFSEVIQCVWGSHARKGTLPATPGSNPILGALRVNRLYFFFSFFLFFL